MVYIFYDARSLVIWENGSKPMFYRRENYLSLHYDVKVLVEEVMIVMSVCCLSPCKISQ